MCLTCRVCTPGLVRAMLHCGSCVFCRHQLVAWPWQPSCDTTRCGCGLHIAVCSRSHCQRSSKRSSGRPCDSRLIPLPGSACQMLGNRIMGHSNVHQGAAAGERLCVMVGSLAVPCVMGSEWWLQAPAAIGQCAAASLVGNHCALVTALLGRSRPQACRTRWCPPHTSGVVRGAIVCSCAKQAAAEGSSCWVPAVVSTQQTCCRSAADMEWHQLVVL